MEKNLKEEKNHFEGIEDEYEKRIQKIVPSYKDFYGSVLSFIPENREIRILELGSGTGFFTFAILAKNDNAKITCIDISKEMLAVAMKKPELLKVRFIEGDFRKVWPDESYDIILTTLCLHHISDSEREKLISNIFSSLSDSGIFINGDTFVSETVFEEDMNLQWWYSEMLTNGLIIDEAKGMLKGRDENLANIDSIDRYVDKIDNAGFLNAHLVYKNRIYGVIVAFK
jgi:ubiquinone/menaquinone biosynthesis C-methylase UbiE